MQSVFLSSVRDSCSRESKFLNTASADHIPDPLSGKIAPLERVTVSIHPVLLSRALDTLEDLNEYFGFLSMHYGMISLYTMTS